ncbi:transglycosylase domain-containing protein [Mucilaginibacter sp. UYCu711]|uniref:transglycosylase domain-containing protein n=1 Tax=Mucilaginibacter sp. UYCu711 TaxID=3156339 RepID=UPI003D19599F
MTVRLSPQDIKKHNWYIWKFFIGCFAFVVILIGLTTVGVFGPLPSLRELENPKSDQASEIITCDKQVIGKYYTKNRSSVPFKDISPDVINALIAKEDNHFYSHSGVDFWRTFSIIPYNLVGKRQGASTLTQQLALNLFTGQTRARNPIKRIIQKLQELIIAVRIEKHYTKQEIITMYLNTVDFGSQTFGISSAAQTYFNTTPAKLTADQAGTLIQMLTAPTANSPIRHPQRALNNRNFVLGRMAHEGFITEAQATDFKARPLGLDYRPINHTEGLAPYFRAVLREDIKKILTTVNKADGTPYDIDRDGLKIYTTLDGNMQLYAEQAQREWMRDLQAQFNSQWKGVKLADKVKNYKLLIDQGIHSSDRYRQLKLEGRSDEEIDQNFNTPDTLNIFTWHGDIDTLMKPIDSIIYCKMLLRNAVMSMDPTTGSVKAWVGGINFEHFKYDQVKIGARQVGSTAKPFTYAVAIENGYSPCTPVDNVPITISGYGGQNWTPGSSPLETLPGRITLRTALAHSQNWVTAYVMKELGPEPVAELIKKMGIHNNVPPYPSICLGVFDATVMDMTAAYSTFVNHGVWTEPTYLLRIEDKNGNIIYNYTPKVKQVMNDQDAYVMVDMLRSVVDQSGATGNRLRWKPGYGGFTNPIGGKTGTTSDNSDGWFIGITPKLVTGVWTGCENRDFHFRTTRMGEGSNSALPIFGLYLKKVYADQSLGIKKKLDFELPKKGLTTVLNCDAYSQQQKGTNEVEKKLSF